MLKELTKIILKAVPCILDLKFGCKVKVKIGVFVTKHSRVDNVKNFSIIYNVDDEIGLTSSYSNFRTIKEEDIQEILGRDITLEDVLVALGKKNLKIAIVVEENNLIINYWDSKPAFKFPRNTCNWIPKKPLHEQSKETWEFLYELMKKEIN